MSTTLIGQLVDEGLLNEMVDEGFIRRFEHDNGDLVGYTYSPRAQWERMWNPATRLCRGLIVSTNGTVVARPFGKFFNLGDQPEVDARYANQPFTLQEKVDGSLGILYEWEGRQAVATKGSFHSAQADWATAQLGRAPAPLPDATEVTHLFEIIYPENRVVVDYGNRESLVLLASIRISDAVQLQYPWPETVQRYPVDPAHGLAGVRSAWADLDTGGFEGFVAVFDDGHRVKLKLDAYVRIHRVLTSTSNRSIWEALAAGEDVLALAEATPDEFHRWTQDQITEFRAAYASIERLGSERFEQIRHLLDDRRAFASEATQWQYPWLLFAMADGKDYAEKIWKELRPEELSYPPNSLTGGADESGAQSR